MHERDRRTERQIPDDSSAIIRIALRGTKMTFFLRQRVGGFAFCSSLTVAKQNEIVNIKTYVLQSL